jgi:hypothetical protein
MADGPDERLLAETPTDVDEPVPHAKLYWPAAQGLPEAQRAAATVPAWPSLRARAAGPRQVARAAAAGDATEVAATVGAGCA